MIVRVLNVIQLLIVVLWYCSAITQALYANFLSLIIFGMQRFAMPWHFILAYFFRAISPVPILIALRQEIF